VSACAGAGKTFALSKRYCKILDKFTKQNSNKLKPDWLGVKNILVITFTNKAAAEMSGRIYEDLNILLNDNEIKELKEQEIDLGENIRKTSDEYKRWLRSTFSQNYISTIDGFCSRILRENAHLIGIDPKFKTFEDVHTEQVFDETLKDFIQQKSNKFDENLKVLLDNTSIYKIRQFIKYLFENRAFVQDWLEFIQQNEKEIKEKWSEDYTPDCDINFLFDAFIKIENYSQYYSASDTDKGIIIFEKLKQSFPKLEATDSHKEKQRIILAEILPLFQTGSGTYFKEIRSWKKANWDNDNYYQEFKSIVTNFCDYLREELPENEILKAPNEYDFKAIPVLKSLVAFYKEFAETLWQKQLELNFLNFDDIILKTKELLQKEQIRQKYSNQFRHIMIDEFQDTNDVRWEIIKLIGGTCECSRNEIFAMFEKNSHEDREDSRRNEVMNFKHSDVFQTIGSLRKSGIFIVGDKKQSIYRFNQADVEVMNRAEEELTHPQSLSFKRGENDEQEGFNNIIISFNDNFRSSKDFIENVINPLFSKIMPESEKSFEAEFEPTTFNENNQSKRKVAEKTDKICTIQAVNADKDTSKEDLKHLSALNAAAIVKDFLKWSEDVKLDNNVAVGVLLRKFSNIQNYLKVFQEQDIPFEIIGGRGLFQQQEAFDLFHFVSVLINPHDDLALIGLLRSPFFAISDKHIHHLKNRKKEQPIFSFMKESVEFEKIVQTIQSWRKDAQILSLDVLLQNILSVYSSCKELATSSWNKTTTRNQKIELSESSNEEKMKVKLLDDDDLEDSDFISTPRCTYESNKIRFGYFSEIGGAQRISNIEKILNILHEFSLEGSSLKNVYNFFKFQIENNNETSQAETPSTAKVQILSIHRSKGLEFPTVIIPEMNAQVRGDSSPISHGRINKNGRIEVGISLDEEGESKKMNLLNSIKKQAKLEIEAEDKRLFYVAVTRAKYKIAFLSEFKSKQTKGQNFWHNYIKPNYEIPDDLDAENWKNLEFEKTKINLLSDLELNNKLKQKTESEPVIWEEPVFHKFKKKFLQVNPHDIMKSISNKSIEKREAKGSSEIALSFGTIIHKIMEKEWWKNKDCKSHIKDYLKNNFPEISFYSISQELKKHITNFKKNELSRIISQIPVEDKFPEFPVIGWIDNSQKYLQVSGIIDLLYKFEGKWFILDYKTDKDKSNLAEYKIQIQTYIWMVKQLYNFEANGQIFFTNPGEIEKVGWDDKYFEVIFNLSPAHRKQEKFNLTPILSCEESENQNLINEILKKKSKDDILIINPTKQQCISQIKYLSDKKLLTPKIQMLTLNQLLKHSEIQGKKISFNFAKLMIRKLCSDKKYTEGMIEFLTDAILKNEKFEVGMKPEFREIENKFKNLKKDKNYFTDADEIKGFNLDLSNKKIILNGFYKDSTIEFELIKRISKSAKEFYFIDNFAENNLKIEFKYSSQIWENAGKFPSQKYEQTCELCFSVQEEVKQVSKLVLSIPNWQEKLDSIKIAVSSLERYVPTISATFTDYGIPFRSTKKEPILKIPVIQLLMNFTELIKSNRIKWEAVFDVFLHPLLEPDDDLFLLEKYCRQNGIIYFEKSENIPENLKNKFHNFEKIIEKPGKINKEKNLKNIIDYLSDFVQINNLKEKIKKDHISSKSLEIFETDLKNFEMNYNDIGLKPDLREFFKDFKKHLESTEIPIPEQNYGIEVIGLLDSLEIPTSHLFILGLIEGDFPISTASNPFLNAIPNNKWSFSLMLLNHWSKLKDKVHYFAPQRDIDGTVLQPSTFLEILKVVKSSDQPENEDVPKSRKEHFQKYYNRMIKNPENNRYLQRHNEFLQNEISDYHGKTEKQKTNELEISASKMDDLLKCPMKFWFSNKLKLDEIEFDEENKKRQQRGSIIHKALEIFGKENGFKEIKKDFKQACILLSEKLEAELKKYKINPYENLLLNSFFKIYREGLSERNKANILVRLLKWNQEFLSDFQEAKYEQTFGMKKKYHPNSWEAIELENDNVILKFRGIIDKILINKENKEIIATDYKTGKVNYKDILDEISSQCIIYYFALKKYFPDFEIKLTYEIIKSLKKGENGISGFIENEEDNDLLLIPYNRKKVDLEIKKTKSLYLDLAKKVISGYFPIAAKEKQDKACKYCEFEKICRKECY